VQDRAGDHGMDELGADVSEITAHGPRILRPAESACGGKDPSESIGRNIMKQFIYKASHLSFPPVGNPS